MPMQDGATHDQAHQVLDMVAQPGSNTGLLQMQGSNEPRPTQTQTAPPAPAMAAAAGPHDPAALTDDAVGASGAALFD